MIRFFQLLKRFKKKNRNQVEPSEGPKYSNVLDATGSGAWQRVGGMSLVERKIFHLRAFGIRDIRLFLNHGTGSRCAVIKRQKGQPLKPVIVTGNVPEVTLSLNDITLRALYINASHFTAPVPHLHGGKWELSREVIKA